MTIKNFLKTAVLGIALYSAFSMSNGIASPNISLQDICNKLSKYNNNNKLDLSLPAVAPGQDFTLDNSDNVSPLSEDLEIDVLNALSSIVEIIEKTLDNNIIGEEDLTNLYEHINYLETHNIPQCEYTDDIDLIMQNKNVIIQEINTHMLN